MTSWEGLIQHLLLPGGVQVQRFSHLSEHPVLQSWEEQSLQLPLNLFLSVETSTRCMGSEKQKERQNLNK